MLKTFFSSEVILKKETNYAKSTSRLHSCGFDWSERCAYCEIDFDDLKLHVDSSNGLNYDITLLIKDKIQASICKLEGVLKIMLRHKLKFIMRVLELEQCFEIKLQNNFNFIDEELDIRLESLKEELELVKQNCFEQIIDAEKDISQYVSNILYFI